MTRGRLLVWLWLSFIAFSSYTVANAQMCAEYESRWHDGLRHIVGKRHMDCSEAMHEAARWGKLPGVRRTTAKRMAYGLDGWDSAPVCSLLKDARELDLCFWSWLNRPDRIHGHVGAVVLGRASGLLELVHASSRQKRVVQQPCDGSFNRDISAVRRLTIGKAMRHRDN